MNDEIRIGVYVCYCGTNISQTVDVEAVAEHATTLPGVVAAKTYKYMCSDPGQEIIKREIAEQRLNRLVVASCSPLMHEATFRRACEEGGLNGYLFQMVNIREQCSWVHHDRGAATAKAKRLLGGAVRRVRYHRPMKPREVPVRPETLVIGGGIAGIEAALRIADSGKKVYLVEKEPSIGGHMAKFDKTFPTLDCAACILTPKMVSVGQHPNIELMSYSEVEEVSGFVGDFKVMVRRKTRYIDEEKCTGCGQCIERCPTQYRPYRTDGCPHGVPGEPELDPDRKSVVDQALAAHQAERAPLISVLQDINHALGYLPEDTLRYTSRRLAIPLASVYHVATFYKAFSLSPRGKHVIRVCMGTACQVRGAPRVLEALASELGIRAGETTEDLQFSLETVNCLGACPLAPVVVTGSKYHGNVGPRMVPKILKACEEDGKQR